MAFLLVIIYLAFISLGLPDSLLGSAWPSMYEGFGVAISVAGIASMIVAGGTIISSLLSNRLIKKFDVPLITIISVVMTAAALLGISFAKTYYEVCLCAIPLGLGAGSIDAALNNFVALHYKAIHMNWLHAFWGVGATIGPIVLSALLLRTGTWRTGYRTISIIQFALVAILLSSLPLWEKVKVQAKNDYKEQREQSKEPRKGFKLIGLPKAKPTMIAFFCYCALESTVGLWGSTYLVEIKNITAESAAGWISLYFLGITAGRILSGIFSLKMSQKVLIRIGQLLIAIGIIFMLLPLSSTVAVVGLFFIGLGCAPIFPSLLHETPNTFGKANSQALMGLQMACAYIGTTFMPPLFGLLGEKISYKLFPYYLAALLLIMIGTVLTIYRKKRAVKQFV